MRRILVLVFALTVVLVGGMGVLLYRTSPRPEVAAQIEALPRDSPYPADRESPFTAPEPKETTNKLPTRLEPLPMRVEPFDTKQGPEAALPKDQQTGSVKYPFPTGSEIGSASRGPRSWLLSARPKSRSPAHLVGNFRSV
jgi:hypothetical protein